MSGHLSYVPTGHTFYFIKIPLGSAAGHQITYLHTNQYWPSYIPRGQCSEYHAGTQKCWCGCVKLWYCWVWSKSRWSNMIITMGWRLLNQHRPIMQATELTGDGDSTILNHPNPKLTLKNSLKTSRFSNESNLYKQLFMERECIKLIYQIPTRMRM